MYFRFRRKGHLAFVYPSLMFTLQIGALLSLFVSLALAQVAVFNKPINNTFYEVASQISVELVVIPEVTNESVLTQQCGTDIQTSPILAPLGSIYTANMTLPSDFTGTCSYSATFIPNDREQPEPISINVRYPITFVYPVAEHGYYYDVDAGSSTSVALTYSPSTVPALSFDVQLECPNSNLEPYVQSILANGQYQNFNIPADYYGILCKMSIPDTNPEYSAFNAQATLNVFQFITISAPQPNQIVYVNQPFELLISCAYTATVIGTARVIFTSQSGSSVNSAIYNLNETYMVTLDDGFLGKVITVVEGTPEDTFPPGNINIYVVYGLTMTFPLGIINPGYPFTVMISSSSPLGPGVPTEIALNLNVPNGFTHTWPSVTLNALVQLSGISGINGYNPKCTLRTVSSGQYFEPTSRLVTVMDIPTGGQALPISDNDLRNFLFSIHFPATEFDRIK